MTHLPRDHEEAAKYIREGVRISRQMVAQAKAHILNQALIRTDKRLEELLDHVEARKPSIVVINPQVDFLPMLQQVAAWIFGRWLGVKLCGNWSMRPVRRRR
jgi:hypothetical protein